MFCLYVSVAVLISRRFCVLCFIHAGLAPTSSLLGCSTCWDTWCSTRTWPPYTTRHVMAVFCIHHSVHRHKQYFSDRILQCYQKYAVSILGIVRLLFTLLSFPVFVVPQEKILASVGPKYFKATFLPAAADRAVVAL